ncbi:hypothetical protein ATCC90586_006742 [Pythium insidiosum]|nr:hypothetical protein ATCC90586_006742 [Pythium insidiosum]
MELDDQPADLGRRHAASRYNRDDLRGRVPWYRESANVCVKVPLEPSASHADDTLPSRRVRERERRVSVEEAEDLVNSDFYFGTNAKREFFKQYRQLVARPYFLRELIIDNADIDDNECAAFMSFFEKNLSIKRLRMSRNCIGKSENLNVVQPHFVTGGEAIATMLHANLVLERLDLSWNYLRLESSVTLARSMLENHTLTELNLAYNACGDPGAMMFGEALRFNECLEVLDLSYNSVGSLAPIGGSSSGAASGGDDELETLGIDVLFKHIDRDQSGYVDRREVMMVLNRIGLFPRMENLDTMLDRFNSDRDALLESNEEFSAFLFHAVFQLIDSDHSGKIDADEVEDAFKMLGIHNYDEKEILEAIAMYDISGDGQMEESEFVAFMKDRLLERIKLQLTMSDSATTASDDKAFVELIDSATQKPWVVPVDGTLEVEFLYEREAFASSEEAYRYSKISQAGIEQLIHNITRVALSKSEQEELFNVATEFWDKTRSTVLTKSSLQQLLTNTRATFRLSKLAARPAMTTKELVALKLVQIEAAVCDRWLSCSQAAQIIACMPSAFHARPETARLLFSRLIDIANFHRLFDAMTRDEQYICAKSLGWLNIFNPMFPERAYSLDLSIWDEREMTKLLVELAITEPGENWINQSFSTVRGEPGIPGWKLPVRWEKEDDKDGSGVNRSGFLELEYYSGADRGCMPVPSFRKALFSHVLAGTRLYSI